MDTNNYRHDDGTDLQGNTYTTARTIAAIQAAVPGFLPSGPVVQLPEQIKLTVVGPGFHHEFVKVRCDASTYFVFRDDLLETSMRESQC